MTSRRPPTSAAAQAELVLLPSLKSCLVNLPSSLVAVLLNSNTLAQNVIVELSYRLYTSLGPAQDARSKPPAVTESIFLGWTGMQSQRKLVSLVGKDGIRGGNGGGGGGREDKDVATVEIDATFARTLGLTEGTKIGVHLHLDPPLAHTVNIEPVTATDWEIIELHARFLEMNFLSQVRALPNPSTGSSHPLTLHLTPTSTANITITSLTPAAGSNQAFVKISPDAEVIVAPKTRTSSSRPSSARDNRSVASTSKRSVGGKSTTSAAVRHRSATDERPPLFLRGITRALQNEWFEDGGEEMKDEGLKIWLDPEHLLSKTLRGVTWVAVTVIRPAGLQEPVDAQGPHVVDPLPATKIVAKLSAWEDAPDSRHVALSSLLCATLNAQGVVGGLVRIEPAPTPLPKTASALKDPSQQASKDAIVKRLKITPYAGSIATGKSPGFKFGGESKAEKEEAIIRIKAMFGKLLFEGPVTDGMLLPKQDSWPGGTLDFEPLPSGDPSKPRLNWLLGAERKLDISVQPENAPPKLPRNLGEPLPEQVPTLVGVQKLVDSTRSAVLYNSSVLLTGAIGSGKTSVTHVLAQQLRDEYLFHITYFPCRTLVTDETRVKTIKETLQRIFASAAWGARLGGRALVILDDLDRLCPVETELQVDANGRSKQVSELLCSITREICHRDSGVVLLATAQSKEAVHNVIVGGHIIRDIVTLKAPDKLGRRKVLELLIRQASESNSGKKPAKAHGDNASSEWMEGSEGSRPVSASGDQSLGFDLDLLDIAGQTDGYMPGDLDLLVSRARSEALIRVISQTATSNDVVTLTADDFAAAIKDFTPASLRGVSLHSSTTTFASIGGLTQTRQTLLETLQYPTTYAPLFAKCPLRLRSGLLLYGYPGCGKTLLASAVAGECGLNFISVKGPEILNKYIGASEKSVRDLFERAEAARPCILFFDEFDSIAPRRGHDSTGVTDRVVNMLLTMMDGAEGLSGVYILAATSRPDLIDPALLRPGRLDKSLLCDMPDQEDRLDILRAVTTKLHVDHTVLNGTHDSSLTALARQTEGYSGADLQAIVYNAHLEAIHELLGPGDTAAQDFGKRRTGPASKPQSFTYFRLGGESGSQQQANGASNTTVTTPATLAAERAEIAASLSAMNLARRKAKADRHASHRQPPYRPNSAGTEMHAQTNGVQSASLATDHTTPKIEWRHLQKSLQETRSSISVQERRRLERIYREFVVGRNGEMSDGQGSSEIGGRTSLM